MFKALQGRTSTLNTLHNQWSYERMPSKMFCFKKGLLVLLPSLRQGGDSSSCGCDVFCTSFAMDAHSCLAQMALVWQAEAYSEQLWGRLLQIVQRNTFLEKLISGVRSGVPTAMVTYFKCAMRTALKLLRF